MPAVAPARGSAYDFAPLTARALTPMALHVALLESLGVPLTGAIARRCAEADAPLHLIGPLPFAEDDAALRSAGPANWGALDLWVHPGWRDFRDAMSRERCLYFAAEGERDPKEAPYRPNSVLVFGDASGSMPEKIRGKYPERLFRLPSPQGPKPVALANQVAAVLTIAASRMSDAPPKKKQRRR